VAGCGANKKGDKCRLQANFTTVMQLSEFQVRRELAELKTKFAELLTEAQRLARIVHAADPNAVKNFLDVQAPVLDTGSPVLTGANKNGGKVTVTERHVG
jgi:hypothetical protein